MDIMEVLDAYRNGDEARRMSLFMAYRELREQFTMIEEESAGEEHVFLTFPWRKKRSIARAA